MITDDCTKVRMAANSRTTILYDDPGSTVQTMDITDMSIAELEFILRAARSWQIMGVKCDEDGRAVFDVTETLKNRIKLMTKLNEGLPL